MRSQILSLGSEQTGEEPGGGGDGDWRLVSALSTLSIPPLRSGPKHSVGRVFRPQPRMLAHALFPFLLSGKEGWERLETSVLASANRPLPSGIQAFEPIFLNPTTVQDTGKPLPVWRGQY